jgi:hypothetical protein
VRRETGSAGRAAGWLAGGLQGQLRRRWRAADVPCVCTLTSTPPPGDTCCYVLVTFGPATHTHLCRLCRPCSRRTSNPNSGQHATAQSLHQQQQQAEGEERGALLQLVCLWKPGLTAAAGVAEAAAAAVKAMTLTVLVAAGAGSSSSSSRDRARSVWVAAGVRRSTWRRQRPGCRGCANG